MCEHGCRAPHNEGHDGPNIRPKQLRNREVSWEGSHRSKLMSRRTERSYKADGTDKLAQHSKVRCSVPEVNDPVAEQAFTSLLRETCGLSPSATTGAAVSNDRRAGTGVSRGHSTDGNEPETKKPDGLTTREGLNLAGRHDHRWSCSRSVEADRPSSGQRSSWQRKSAASSARTVRNRRTRTRMSGGVGARRGNPPGDPISPHE